MSKVNYVELLKHKPTVFFQCQDRPDGTLALQAREFAEDCETFLGLEGDGKGKTARELFRGDAILVDDWVQFILMMRQNPKARLYDARDGDVVSRRTLQFLQLMKGWAGVELDYNMGTGEVRASFAPPKDAVTKIGVQHLMNLKQTLWLEGFIESTGGWEIDLPSQTIYLSRSLAKALGFAGDALIVPLERFLGAVHPDDLPAVQQALTGVKDSHTRVYNRGIRDDGSMVHFSSFAIPGYSPDGTMTRIIGQSQNITDRQLAVEQLSLSEQRFRGIVENSLDLFFVMDPEAVITYASPNVSAVTGYDAGRVVGMHLYDFIAFDDERLQLENQFANVLSHNDKTTAEYLGKHADGRMLWLQLGLSGIVDAGGRVVEVVAVCHDITEEKKHAENLRYLGTHDSLTDVYNRYFFESEMDRIDSEGTTGVGVIMTDLNGLKLVNDAFGTRRGDELLREASTLLERVCGSQHMVFRVGGDEFAVLAYDTTPAELEDICARIEAECEKTRQRPIPVNLSWGTAYRTSATESMRQLYNAAESSMYSNKLLESTSMRSHVLSSLKETLRSRNLETADHTRRMESMVMAVGKKLGLSASEFDRLALLASMHDIGKVAIPDSVINKPGELDDKEWEVMRTHSEIGSRIATTAQELSVISTEIACHHERWDGGGYPFGKKEEDIPLLSRIISVVDSYDVMTHKRVYKENTMSHEDAIAELKRCSGTQFDPGIVESFLAVFGDLTEDEMRAMVGENAGEDGKET